ncbi:hypothetical protein [Nostoc sp.]
MGHKLVLRATKLRRRARADSIADGVAVCQLNGGWIFWKVTHYLVQQREPRPQFGASDEKSYAPGPIFLYRCGGRVSPPPTGYY